jgi:hypothetical protein
LDNRRRTGTDEKAHVSRLPTQAFIIHPLCPSHHHLSIHSRREYYQRNNNLIQQYVYIDKLLDSSLPHTLLNEYQTPLKSNAPPLDVPVTITEEPFTSPNSYTSLNSAYGYVNGDTPPNGTRVKRTPKNLYKIPDERSPLIPVESEDEDDAPRNTRMPHWIPEDEAESGDSVVTVAIYVNLVANTILLILKIAVTIMTSSISVLAALVDAVLDFMSTAIVWTTTRLVSNQDTYLYPVGRSKLEPIGILVFSVIMITSFFQVGLEGFQRLTHGEHETVILGVPAVAIMASTVIIKGLCWVYCRLIKNSSVQALAQDAATDVVFNTFSIIFPLGTVDSHPPLLPKASFIIQQQHN